VNSILRQLSKRLSVAVDLVAGPAVSLVQASQDEKFGDYQSNAAMGLAKRLARKPREVAEAIPKALDEGVALIVKMLDRAVQKGTMHADEARLVPTPRRNPAARLSWGV